MLIASPIKVKNFNLTTVSMFLSLKNLNDDVDKENLSGTGFD